MKIAISGKGGTGKTTFASVLARLLAAEGRKVLAVDADPDANLGAALGFDEEELKSLVPISEMEELIAERTGTNDYAGSPSGSMGKFFKINPRVDDIPDRFSIEKHGIKFLLMGKVETGGGGCACPANVVLKRVVSNLVIARDEDVILDMEAGLEHLGRGTAEMTDGIIVIVEPGERSIMTLQKIKPLAKDLNIKKISVVANKIRSEDDVNFINSRLKDEEIFGIIHYSEDAISADRNGLSPYDTCPHLREEVNSILKKLHTIHLQDNCND